MSMLVRYALAVTILCTGCLLANAEDKAPPTAPSAAQPAAPAVEAAPTAAPAAAEKQPGPKIQQFQAVFAQWKKLLTELMQIREGYATFDDAKRKEAKDRYVELTAAAQKLYPVLSTTVEGAYEEDPANKETEQFMLAICGGNVKMDNYEESYRLGETLIKHKRSEDAQITELQRLNMFQLLEEAKKLNLKNHEGLKKQELIIRIIKEKKKNLYYWTGLSACMIGKLDIGEKYLKIAAQNGSIGKEGRRFLGNMDYFKKAWEDEQKIRAAEAKANDLPRVLLKTNKGDIEIELFENEAPMTVANFISLVEKGFYDGLTFHRVLPGFMAQGGCPDGTGRGGPGYTIPCECYTPNHRLHFRGTLSMAKAIPRDTGGSQFFLTFVPTKNLDGLHTAFGRVVKGIDVLSKIRRRDPDATPPLPQPDEIIEAKVLRKRPHEYKPTKSN